MVASPTSPPLVELSTPSPHDLQRLHLAPSLPVVPFAATPPWVDELDLRPLHPLSPRNCNPGFSQPYITRGSCRQSNVGSSTNSEGPHSLSVFHRMAYSHLIWFCTCCILTLIGLQSLTSPLLGLLTPHFLYIIYFVSITLEIRIHYCFL